LFTPYNGNQIQINGSLFTIPNAGIAGLANTSVFVNGTGASNLAASTTYYVYAFNNAGTVTADFRTDGNGHITDTTAGNEGVEVRCSTGTTPDPTRSLIGMIYTNASSQFADAPATRHVANWFNRRLRVATGALTADRSTASTTYVELNSEIQASFLTWGDGVDLSALLSHSTNTGGSPTGYSAIGLDGVSTLLGGSVVATFAASLLHNADFATAAELSEGRHFITLAVKVNASTGTWQFVANERGYIRAMLNI
jgi:hypothetical protein